MFINVMLIKKKTCTHFDAKITTVKSMINSVVNPRYIQHFRPILAMVKRIYALKSRVVRLIENTKK